MQQSYSVEDGVSALIKRIGSLRSASERPIIVSIAGGSASGKSSIVAASVAESFKGESITITMDDYFKGKSFVDSETAAGREVNFDHPDYIDLDLL
ncbi:MAG: zeta toxin family protein, partial [Candidatus Micrarchaeota archaeon]|nr:zeta toxin family protein [Candidatus Micrarchaeota archaeon]